MLTMAVKQKSLQISCLFAALSVLLAMLCVSCIAMVPSHAQGVPKSLGDAAATMRLVAAPGTKNGAYDAGVAIAMGPGSHTYWKMPGEAGVPPVFAFNGSENAASATVAFPVPTRITEDGLDAFGYTGLVIFPVKVVPIDPTKPTVLHADVTYAVCNKICLPAHDTATLTLTAKGVGADAAALATSLATVPRQASAEDAAALHLEKGTADGSKQPSWTLTWTGTGAIDDIFADAPEGFFFTTKKTGSAQWTLVEAQGVGLTSHDAIPVSLTLKRQADSLVILEKLDAAKPIQ